MHRANEQVHLPIGKAKVIRDLMIIDGNVGKEAGPFLILPPSSLQLPAGDYDPQTKPSTQGWAIAAAGIGSKNSHARSSLS